MTTTNEHTERAELKPCPFCGEAQPARYQPTAQEVKELRSAFSKTHRRWDGEETACARLMDCQEALITHGGDQLLALDELRVMYAPKATAQPAREWVGLDEEKTEALIEGLAEWSRYVDVDHAHQTLEKHVRDVLEKHGIKEKQ